MCEWNKRDERARDEHRNKTVEKQLPSPPTGSPSLEVNTSR